MAYKNQQQFIDALEEAGELVRIKTYVNPKLEMAEITDRISKSGNGGKALLFERTGYNFPVLMNAYGSERRMCMALGVNHLDDVAKEIEALFKLLASPKEGIIDKLKLLPKLNQFASWMPKVKSGKGDCQEIVMREPDITQLPVITCWPKDGGPFVTLPVIHTKDPNTGLRNVGMYRMQLFGPTLTAMHWHKHKVSAKHFNEYKKLNKRMPIAVALGGDPVYAYSATAPLPENVDEYMLAGFLRKKKVELVKCITQPDVEVPADVDFIIEGYVDPNDELIWEGPFGDHLVYYSLAHDFPVLQVEKVYHRKDAIWPFTVVGRPPQEDTMFGQLIHELTGPMIPRVLPGIHGVHAVDAAGVHPLLLAVGSERYTPYLDAPAPQELLTQACAILGQGQLSLAKFLLIVARHDDQQLDVHNVAAFLRHVLERADWRRDLVAELEYREPDATSRLNHHGHPALRPAQSEGD